MSESPSIESPSAAVQRPGAAPLLAPRPGLFAREVPFGLALAAAVALFLLLGGLGALTDWWWCDEGFTWDMMRRSPWGIIQGTAADVHPPLYYLALHFWCLAWPDPWAMKAFSLFCGLSGLLLAAWTGCLLAGRRAGVLIALLWATCPMILQYSQDARMYPMGLALEVLAVAGWALAPRRPRLGWVLFVLGLAGAMYTQNLCLLFAAALLGGEFLRALFDFFLSHKNSAFPHSDSCLLSPDSSTSAIQVRRPCEPSRPQSAILWVVSAGLTVALLYFPWSFVLRAQMHSKGIAHFFHAHTWWELTVKGIFYPYTLLQDSRGHRWGWLPGDLLLALFPLLLVIGSLRQMLLPMRRDGKLLPRTQPDRNPHSDSCLLSPDSLVPQSAIRNPQSIMLVWVAVAPLLFATLYSQYVSPIYEMSRHGLLYVPFLLLASGVWLAAHHRRWAARLATLALVALGGGYAFNCLKQSRDLDLRPVHDELLASAPLGAPLLFYPSIYRVADWTWAPLPTLKSDAPGGVPASLTSATLVLVPGEGPLREEVRNQARLVIGRAAEARPLYVSRDVSAFALRGVPPGVLAAFARCEPGYGANLIGQQTGRWAPGSPWPADALEQFVHPCGPRFFFTPPTPGNPDWAGLRLADAATSVTLSTVANPAPAAFRALLLGGHFIPKKGDGRVRITWDPPGAVETGGRSMFLVSRLLAPSTPPALTLHIPAELARPEFAPGGDAPPGVYLTWAGLRDLKPEDFQRPGFNGLFYDAGALGDGLYLREGYEESEGMPPSEVRWTHGCFTAEVAVWPGREANEVVLCGQLPAAVRDRKIALIVDEGEPARELKVEAEFSKSDEGEYALRLPRPLSSGIHRLAFTVGTWPSTQTAPGATTPRRLGFRLDGIGLRTAR